MGFPVFKELLYNDSKHLSMNLYICQDLKKDNIVSIRFQDPTYNGNPNYIPVEVELKGLLNETYKDPAFLWLL